jgi:hypothetical protein
MRPLVIALVILGVLFLGLVGAGGYLIYRGSQAIGFKASANPPADFPVYPGAVRRSALSISPPGSHVAVTQIQWATRARPDAVRDFYTTQLGAGDWEITDSTSTAIGFRRRSKGDISTGRLIIIASFGQTIFQAQFREQTEPVSSPG